MKNSLITNFSCLLNPPIAKLIWLMFSINVFVLQYMNISILVYLNFCVGRNCEECSGPVPIRRTLHGAAGRSGVPPVPSGQPARGAQQFVCAARDDAACSERRVALGQRLGRTRWPTLARACGMEWFHHHYALQRAASRHHAMFTLRLLLLQVRRIHVPLSPDPRQRQKRHHIRLPQRIL